MRHVFSALLIVGFAGISGVNVAAAQTAELEENFFTQEVWPIFQASCFKCHGPEKQKGDLRLDFPEAIRRGGELGDIVVPGDSSKSAMIELVSLPADDPDVMPGKGDHLTDEQIATLTKWIDGGAPYGDWTPEFAFKSMGYNLGGGEGDSPEAKLEALAAGVTPASPEALNALLETGAVAGPLSQDNPLLQVGFHLLGDSVTDATLAALAPVKDQVTWLNLAGTAITDDGLAQLEALPNLTRLHLEKTAIGDAGLAHLAGMQQLEYLNLYGTQVSDAGVDQLASLPNLHKLYLWQSKVTEAGAEKLRAAIPAIDINMGVETEAPVAEVAATPDATPNLLARFFDEGSCCAKANAAGEACGHDCCKEAAAANSVCEKCNAVGGKKFALTKLFDADSCCAKAFAEGKDCDHPCCVEALAKGEVCTKCNPGAVEKLAS